MTESVLVRRDGADLWITLNRPESLNAITPRMLDELAAALDQATADRPPRALVLAGAGRAFCAGADLKALPPDSAAIGELLELSRVVFGKLTALELPVVAAVGGPALAGGLELLLCCDFVIAAESARFGDGHARYGLLPGGGGSVRLPARIGAARAKYLMFTAELVDAVTAKDWGLADLVVPDGGLETAVRELTGKFAGKSPLGLARMKRLVQQADELPLPEALAAEAKLAELHAGSHDRNEGLAAFRDKREPIFEGR